LLILGFTKTTLLDYPGHLAATIFTGGCNFRCPYCHNGELLDINSDTESILADEVLSHLEKRKSVLEGVCISGGEPTLQHDLKDMVIRIKEMGLLVKLDTNGSNPDVLKDLVDNNLIDYVAMDIKNDWSKYSKTVDSTVDVGKILESFEYLLSGMVDYEFRTTVTKELVTKEDILQISENLKNSKAWYIQNYKDSEFVIRKGLHGHDEAELKDIVKKIRRDNVHLRGID